MASILRCIGAFLLGIISKNAKLYAVVIAKNCAKSFCLEFLAILEKILKPAKKVCNFVKKCLKIVHFICK